MFTFKLRRLQRLSFPPGSLPELSLGNLKSSWKPWCFLRKYEYNLNISQYLWIYKMYLYMCVYIYIYTYKYTVSIYIYMYMHSIFICSTRLVALRHFLITYFHQYLGWWPSLTSQSLTQAVLNGFDFRCGTGLSI